MSSRTFYSYNMNISFIMTKTAHYAFLYSDIHLNNIEKFCCCDGISDPLATDTIQIHVLPPRNQCLVVKATGKSPVFFGPCMFHFKKDKEAFTQFALEVSAGNPKLIELKTVGVDMESAIYQGFKSNFNDLSRFICVCHLHQLDERKIEKLLEKTSKTSAQKKKSKYNILKDFYCEKSGTHYEYGLAESLDANNFHAKLPFLEEKWKTTVPEFREWFLKHQKVFSEKSMIKSVSVSSNVEDLYYQNDIESLYSFQK